MPKVSAVWRKDKIGANRGNGKHLTLRCRSNRMQIRRSPFEYGCKGLIWAGVMDRRHPALEKAGPKLSMDAKDLRREVHLLKFKEVAQ